MIEVGDGFWNIRGSFKIGGVVDVGTQASLVRTNDGYVILDACDFSDETRRWIDAQTRGGEDLVAVLHLHPFHTVFARALHQLYPKVPLYGTARHATKLPDLPWQPSRTEDPELHARFSGDLTFSVPRGVAFIPANESLHFASVLAFHPASRTLHVDDTLTYVRLPKLLRPFKRDLMMLHPALAKVLEPRSGAVSEFRDWTRELVERCRGVDNLCAAHSACLLARDDSGPPIAERVQAAVEKVAGTLAAHERKHG
ncbi:MAG: hypothetical protein ACOC97_01225 [Myxococcota bacterium]